MKRLRITLAALVAPAALTGSAEAVVGRATVGTSVTSFGSILTDGAGRTLYSFTEDHGPSAC